MLADGRPRDAAEQWLLLARRIAGGGAPEPLSAATHNNAGVAYLLRSDPRRAEESFARAEALWQVSRGLLDAADVAIPGRSSVFHLRLAMQHQAAFTELERQRHAIMWAAADAITAFNSLLACACLAESTTIVRADQSMISSLRSAFGPACPELRILDVEGDGDPPRLADDANVFAAYRRKAAAQAETAPVSYVDAGQFGALVDRAAHLTALIHPRLLARCREA